jgi:hypothetical protein
MPPRSRLGPQQCILSACDSLLEVAADLVRLNASGLTSPGDDGRSTRRDSKLFVCVAEHQDCLRQQLTRSCAGHTGSAPAGPHARKRGAAHTVQNGTVKTCSQADIALMALFSFPAT